jgi:predicted DNA-binding protein (UPF0251 family)
MVRKGRARLQKRPELALRGETHPMAKLTVGEVSEIRALRARGWTQTALAKRFHVTQSSIWRILHNHNWKAA